MKKLFNICAIVALSSAPQLGQARELAPFVDVLVLHASQETSSTWASIAESTSSHVVQYKAPNAQFNWDLGYRIGFDYTPTNSLWRSTVAWTYFNTKAKNNINTALQLVLPEFFSGFLSQNFFFGGTLNWQILMNVIDYEVGPQFAVGKDLTIRPTLGIKAATIYQKINCLWDAVLYKASENVRNDFSGVGPSFSVDASWDLLRNLNLFGNFGTAIMWGNWQVSDTYQRPNVPLVVTATTITTSLNDAKLGTMMFAYCLGLELDSHSKPGIKVQVGYEMQLWTSQLRMLTFQQLPVHGDLTLQGVTCRVILDL